MQDQSIGNVPLVIIAVSLSAVGIVLSLSCSWMTSKKRRVASRALQRGDGLMMHVSGRAMSPKTQLPPHRYSTPSPLVIVPINSVAHTLVAPTIIITPPSPLALLADTASIRSDSSIGSAGDLLMEDDVGNGNGEDENKENNDFCGDSLNEEKARMEKRRFIKVGHNRHITDPVPHRVYNNDTGVSTLREMHQVQKVTTSGTTKSKSREDVSSGHADTTQGSRSRPQAITINVMTSGHAPNTKSNTTEGRGHHISEIDPNDAGNDSECDPVLFSSRPRLKSLEPGTKRTDFHIQRAKGISKVEVGSS